MIQVDYEFYADTYCGTIIGPKNALKQPIIKANSHLNQYMHQEPDETNLEMVKLCLCEVAELIYQDDAMRQEHGGKSIQSENTDGYSVTYTSSEDGEDGISQADREIYSAIRRYLSDTGLLYLGV